MLSSLFNRYVRTFFVVLPLGTILLGPIFPASALPLFGGNQKDSFAGAPPLPAPATVTVDRKQIARIPLRVIGPQPEPVRFIIRTFPANGTLTLLTPAPASEAITEYRPPEDRSITTDTFTFAAANSHGYSTETTVTIKIIDRAGKIDLPTRIEFPKARVGVASHQNLLLKNTGDAPISGVITPPPGWTLNQDSYDLKPQEEARIEISLLASVSGLLQGDLQFSHSPSHPVSLKANVEEWIQATPDPVKLATKPGEKIRQGSVRISNDGHTQETVLIESDPPLLHPDLITLQPGEARDVPLSSANTQSEPFGGTLRLIKGEKKKTQSIHRLLLWNAEAVGPILKIHTDTSSAVLVPEGTNLFTPITLENEGGREGVWTIQASPPFAIDSTTLRILPGRSIDLHASLATQIRERTDGSLKVIGAGQTFEIPLVANPSPQPPPSATERRPHGSPKITAYRPPLSAGSSGPGAVVQELSLPSANVRRTNAEDFKLDPELAQLASKTTRQNLAVPGSVLRKVKARSAILEIPLPENIHPETLLLQVLNMNLDSAQNITMLWEDLNGVSPTRNTQGRTEFHIQNLSPLTNYTIRILGPKLPNGKRVVLHQCDFTTSAPTSWFTLQNVTATIALAVVLFLGRAWRLRRIRGW